MDAQAIYMFQRNPNERRSDGPQRPNNGGNVKNNVFQGKDITGTLYKAISNPNTSSNVKSSTQYHLTQLPVGRPPQYGDPTLIPLLLLHNVDFRAQPPADNNLFNILLSILPWIFLIALFFFIMRRATQGQQNIFSFGKSRAKLVLEDR